jgi:hypothetical protein
MKVAGRVEEASVPRLTRPVERREVVVREGILLAVELKLSPSGSRATCLRDPSVEELPSSIHPRSSTVKM